MNRILLLLVTICTTITAGAQVKSSGKLVDAGTKLPVEGATVTLLPVGISQASDAAGNFIFKKSFGTKDSIQITDIGYATKTISANELRSNPAIGLLPKHIQMSDVTVTSTAGQQYSSISKMDISMRGVSNSQEVLRIIPGIVIGQHQGGGKAEQIFLRGFDADHGTDFREDVDGLPINMPSHAHGQGFADSHFIIPETIESVNFRKGPYVADKGDFATTGSVDYNTKTHLADNEIKLEGGMFNTYRALGMFNLLNKKAAQKQQSWYMASEYRYSDAYFDNPQHFKRFNLFTKYNGRISKQTMLTISATTFWSKWNASGQIPDRAVAEGLIGFYGAIDPFEGGLVYRSNANAQIVTSLHNGDVLKNQIWYSNSHFDLHTNFTFFLVDSINGDEIRQRESRNLMGYNGSCQHSGYIGTVKLASEAGLQIRDDMTNNSELSHTKDRYTLINRVKLGDIKELSISPYLSETFILTRHLNLNAGLRFDQYYHSYNNKFAGDTTLPGVGLYKANANTFSPKLNLYYHVNNNLQFYLTSGRGFHSNDTRAVVVTHGYDILPKAYSADFGAIFKPVPKLLINAAVWNIYLQQEFVYGGDGGDVSFNGRTKRVGFDFSGRYQPIPALYFDMDLNYAHGRALDADKGADYIPLAPVWTSTGGITYTKKKGFNGSLRYRFVGDRPGNEDNSLVAKGYFITDAVINYRIPKYEFGMVINNVLNTKWKETQFDTETRLKGEAQPVDEICFTPGTPFALKFSITRFF